MLGVILLAALLIAAVWWGIRAIEAAEAAFEPETMKVVNDGCGCAAVIAPVGPVSR